MSRNPERRRSGYSRDRRVVFSAVGMLALTAVVALQPLASDAAAGDPDQIAAAAEANQAADPATAADGDPSGGTAPDESSNGSSSAAPTASSSSAAADAGTGAGAEPAPAVGADGASAASTAPPVNPTSTEQPVGQQPGDGSAAPAPLDTLGDDCSNSDLEPHDGFQNGNRCVSTAFGEVGAAETNPSLIIRSAPQVVRANRAFDLRVSTRNLVRDRFLAAAKGGYYKESSFLNEDGLVRGHFHTACRMLSSRRTAPDPAPVPAFFAATEDGAGGSEPDTVTVRIPGLPRGLAQCAVWAGDGSHRVPMMQRANQIPAFDVVRIVVR